ncbi:MAG: hypothetical protein M3680_01165 [Myxococcota bacterium]|nr:hypothetical protein [Myxococcota bacterium]
MYPTRLRLASLASALVTLGCGCGAGHPGAPDGGGRLEPDAGPRPAALFAPIPADLRLAVQEGDPGGIPSVHHDLAVLEVVALGPERRVVSFVAPVAYVDVAPASPVDRLYHQASFACDGDGGPFTVMEPIDGKVSRSISQIQNLLANGDHVLSPRAIVAFPSAGTYTCTARYALRTSYDFTDGVDRVVTGEGGGLAISAPLAPWARQCFWPGSIARQPAHCAYPAPAVDALIEFGASRDRTPIDDVVVPHGATAIVHADGYLTTCSGTGGAGAELCPPTSSDRSVVRSRIVVSPDAGTPPACLPEVTGSDAVWKTISRRVHHAPIYNRIHLTAPSDPACANRYAIHHELTVTSGAPVLVHANGTVLSVTEAD